MNVTANVSRRNTYLNQVGSKPSLESYLLAMEPYILAITSRSQAAISLPSQEDLEQEARLTLVTVYQKYSRKKPIDLYRLGSRAIFNHIRDLYEAATHARRGGHSPRGVRRGTAETSPAVFTVIEDHLTLADPTADQLDRVLVREALDRLLESASQIERRTFRAAMTPTGLDSTEARRIFRTLRGRVRRHVKLALAR